ncbi:MAG: hypothetical protein U1F43_01835 [Myxococcota bacterium]
MPTDVLDAPGGNRLLYIDGPVLRAHPGGPRLAYIEEPDILDAPAGHLLLHLADDEVKKTPSGPALACWDAATLRRAPGFPALLVVDVRDVRTADGRRRYYLDGTMPTMIQLTAALHHLDPSLFAPSAEELAQLYAHFSATEPGPVIDGAWQVASASGAAQRGTVHIASRPSSPWLAVEHAAADGRSWKGIGTRTVGPADRLELVIAMAPDGSADLGVLLDGDGDGPTMAWLPRAVAAGRDEVAREGPAARFEAGLTPHARPAEAQREALVAPGDAPVWRLHGKEVFTAWAEGDVQLWHLVVDGDALHGALIAGQGVSGDFELTR